MSNVQNIGIIGDGQLAKMLIQAGLSYNVNFYVLPLGNREESICKSISTLVTSYQELVQKSDIITYEFENILPIPEHLRSIISEKMLPTLKTLETIQSKIFQKQILEKVLLTVPETFIIGNKDDIINYIEKHPNDSYVIKCDKGGYNGKGVMVFNTDTTINDVDQFLGLNNKEQFILEKKC